MNDSKAKVHTVEGTFFLVTPGIFQRYVGECSQLATRAEKDVAWLQLQRCFERLDLHLKRPNGQNIWSCKVKGPRKTSSLNGYLVRESKDISEDVPTNNPFLKLSS
ncbi:hypothetical protein D3C85_1482440 [compost metagenome]